MTLIEYKVLGEKGDVIKQGEFRALDCWDNDEIGFKIFSKLTHKEIKKEWSTEWTATEL